MTEQKYESRDPEIERRLGLHECFCRTNPSNRQYGRPEENMLNCAEYLSGLSIADAFQVIDSIDPRYDKEIDRTNICGLYERCMILKEYLKRLLSSPEDRRRNYSELGSYFYDRFSEMTKESLSGIDMPDWTDERRIQFMEYMNGVISTAYEFLRKLDEGKELEDIHSWRKDSL